MSEPRENPEVVHEESDVNVRAILGVGVGLAVLALVVHLLLALLFGYYTREAARQPIVFPLSLDRQGELPPEPRLQTNPQRDLRDLRAREDAILNGYGWVDQKAGIARIPIAEAMRLVVQRGLPTRGVAP
jgi:hypothetical protein